MSDSEPTHLFSSPHTYLLPSIHYESRLIFNSSLLIIQKFPSLTFSSISLHTSWVACCLCQGLTKGPSLENGSGAQSPCSVLLRVPETVSIHIPFESTMQPTAGALQIGRDKGEMRGGGKEMALLQTIAVNGIIFSPQRLH